MKELEESYLYYTHSLPLFSIDRRILFFFRIAIAPILYMPLKRLLLNQLTRVFVALFVKVSK